MILLLGGTTEGRIAAEVIDGAGKPFFYSTKGNRQVVDSVHAIRLCGAMDEAMMAQFCTEKDIRLLVDAAHPFAVQLHQTVSRVSEQLNLPVIRLERKYPPRNPDFIWCEDYEDAVRRLKNSATHRLLALSGVNTLAPLKPYWSEHACWFRILNRKDSRLLAAEQGFPAERLLFYEEDEEGEVMDRLCPDAILTKESGDSGFFSQKTEAAKVRGIAVYVVKRPKLPENFQVVYGEYGLRKKIEVLLPDFFPLHCGYTTGTCATAAAKAALQAWISKEEQEECEICLPSGEPIRLPVYSTEQTPEVVCCSVRKESGDDPDITDGCLITASLRIRDRGDDTTHVTLKGGKGVGIVTLPGLGLEVGGPAINCTPRRMITEELVRLACRHSLHLEIEVTISVENGEELARRTFNPRLGIVNGISIIGTSGIVRPFSSEAFVASIRKEIQVAKAIGCTTLVVNSGAKSERFLKNYLEQQRADFPVQAFVHYGNFIGETLKIAEQEAFPEIILGIMLGKAIKLAEGALDTHSQKVLMNKDFVVRLAQESGCSSATLRKIEQITLARELWNVLPEQESAAFFDLVVSYCYKTCQPCLQKSHLTLLLIDEEGRIRGNLSIMTH